MNEKEKKKELKARFRLTAPELEAIMRWYAESLLEGNLVNGDEDLANKLGRIAKALEDKEMTIYDVKKLR